jgi:hypothetical protein
MPSDYLGRISLMLDRAAGRSFGVAAAALWLAVLVAEPATAQPPLEFLFKPDGSLDPFESKPANDLMTKAEHERYLAALSELECETAEQILNGAFVREYPRFTRARKKKDTPVDLDYEAWWRYATAEFDEYSFCLSHKHFKEADAELRKQGKPAPKYTHYEPTEQRHYDNRVVEGRDLALRAMLSNASDDYPPALVVFAELVRRGDLFDAGPDMEFYLLTRACHLGHDCARLRARLDELGDMLPANRREELTETARAKSSIVEYVFVHGGKP